MFTVKIKYQKDLILTSSVCSSVAPLGGMNTADCSFNG